MNKKQAQELLTIGVPKWDKHRGRATISLKYSDIKIILGIPLDTLPYTLEKTIRKNYPCLLAKNNLKEDSMEFFSEVLQDHIKYSIWKKTIQLAGIL